MEKRVLKLFVVTLSVISKDNFLISDSISLMPSAVNFWSLRSKIEDTWFSVKE